MYNRLCALNDKYVFLFNSSREEIVRPIYVNCLMIINNIFYINILVIKSINIWGVKFVKNKAAGINTTRDALAMKIYHNNFCTHS